MCTSVCLHVVCTPSAYSALVGKRRVVCPLELELQRLWVLESNLSPLRATGGLNYGTFISTLKSFY